MASDSMDLTVRLLGDSSDLDAATRGAEESTGRLAKTMAGLGVAGAAGGAALSVGFARTADLEEGQARLQAQLGLTAEQAGEMGALAGSIYAENFGVDMTQVNDAIKSVAVNLGDIKTVGEESFRGATEAALTLADVMGVDVAESTQAAAALVKNGLAKDSEEAFDIIAAGFQGGANKADDFLATLTEYSPQFAKFGFTGEQTMNLLSAGLQAGARDSDVLSDAFKEFNLQALDLGGTAPAGFKAIGLDAKAAAAAIAEGGTAAGDMTTRVLQGLANIDDPLQQNAAGVALFGTTWEDTMRSIIEPMAAASGQSVETSGSVDQMTAAMGGTGKARVETLRREFDMWVQSQIAGQGVSSTAVAAIGSFGPAALGAAGSLGSMAAGLAAMNAGAALARVGQLASAAATGVWTAAQWLLNAALTMNPIGIVVLAIAGLVAAIVVAYKKSETFRTFVNRLWAAVKSGALGAWSALKAFGSRFSGWVTGLVNRGARVIGWFKDLPSRIKGALGSLGNVLTNAGRQIIEGLLRGITDRFNAVRNKLAELTSMLPDWKGPASVDATILYGSGALVAGGFEAGFVDRFAAVKGAMGSATASLPGAVSTTQRSAVGGATAPAVHIHTPAVITTDRQLIELIEGAQRRTGRARTVARARG